MTREPHGPRPARWLVINWPVVEQRRIAAGMTHAQLAGRVGVAAVTGPVRLWLDRDHDTVQLGLLERLCQVLDLHPVELFTAPTRVGARHALVPAGMPGDDLVVEAALATLDAAAATSQAAPISRAGLATALGWPLGRLVAALAGLDDALAGRGVRVDVGHDDDRPVYGLRARTGRPQIAVRLQQLGLVRRRDRSPTLELADDVRDALLLDTP